MKERLVADWLTKAGERGGLDVAYCQILLAQGCQILRAGHSPTEAGKDIIAIAPNRELRAYQIKSGNIGLKEFEAIQPQITALVEAAILHPSVCRGLEHRSFLVTTGKFSEPVETRVQGFNDAWQRRGFKPLTLIRGTELQPAFMSLAADFWPEEPPEVRAFLALYLAEGKGDFDHKAFAGFLLRLLPKKKLSKPAVARRIAVPLGCSRATFLNHSIAMVIIGVHSVVGLLLRHTKLGLQRFINCQQSVGSIPSD